MWFRRYDKQPCFNVVMSYFMSTGYKWINTYTYFKSFYGAVLCVELIQHRKRFIYGERMEKCVKTVALFLRRCHLCIRFGVLKKLQYDRRIHFCAHQIRECVKGVDGGCRSVMSFMSGWDLFFTSVLTFFTNITSCTYFQATCDWNTTSRSGVFGIDPTNEKIFSISVFLFCVLMCVHYHAKLQLWVLLWRM
jgi:hypothetical protein